MTNILHIDASGRQGASNSRKMSKDVVEAIQSDSSTITYRDVGQGLHHLNDAVIESFYTSPEQRTDEQKTIIELSDALVAELMAADVLVIGIPMYNFAMPAAFKAWCDLVARAGVTFKYTETGPIGLLEGKKAYVVITSGGIPIDSPLDFLTPWLKHFLSFLGIKDIEIIKADGLVRNAEASLARAKEQIESLAK